MIQPTLITDELLHKLASAHARLSQLMETRVPAEEPEAATIARHTEMKILTEQISAVFLAHAAEFLGAIFVLKTEYSPMIRALSPLVRHAIAISGSQAPISEAAQSEVMEKNQ